MTFIFRLEPKNLAAEVWKEVVFKGSLWLRASNEAEARQKAADKSFLMGLRANRHLPLRSSPWIDMELTRCERDDNRQGIPEVGIVVADGRLLGNDEPAPWRWVSFSREQLDGPQELRLRAEFSERSKTMAHADRGSIYWRAEAHGARTYYFSPEAAEVVDDVLAKCGENLCVAPDLQKMLREGFQSAKW
ncbi:MAG TPA: hypothetical protein VKV96_15450 [Roseiarcus sp.]|nr:hypothetical protein [Roseiarcus sp.]